MIGYGVHEVRSGNKSIKKAEWLAKFDELLADAHYLYNLYQPAMQQQENEVNAQPRHEEACKNALQRSSSFIDALNEGRVLSHEARHASNVGSGSKIGSIQKVSTVLKDWAVKIRNEQCVKGKVPGSVLQDDHFCQTVTQMTKRVVAVAQWLIKP